MLQRIHLANEMNISFSSPLLNRSNYVRINGGGLKRARLADNLSLSPLDAISCGKDNY